MKENPEQVKTDITERLAAGQVVTFRELNNRLRADIGQKFVADLVREKRAKRIPWITEAVDNALVRPGVEVRQDEAEAKVITNTIRKAVLRSFATRIEDGGLPVRDFHRLGNRTGNRWKEEWLQWMTDNQRVITDGEIIRPGRYWSLSHDSLMG